MEASKRKEKGKKADLYRAYRQYNSTTKRSYVDHTENNSAVHGATESAGVENAAREK